MSMCYKLHIDRNIDMKNILQVILMTIPFAVDASVYKWVDENGKVHYGDRPQAEQPAVEVTIDEAPAARSYSDDGMSRAEKRERLLQSMQEDRIEKQEQRDKLKAEKQKNRQKCNRYRDRMRHYQRASAMYNLDKDGNRVYISDAQRARATKNLQARINKYCK